MNEIPIFAKTYDLLLWLVPATLKYPREHRFALAIRTQEAAFEFNELIVLARKTRDKRDLLLRADAHLEQLRLYLRLAHDLRLLTLRQYEHISREVRVSHHPDGLRVRVMLVLMRLPFSRWRW